MSKEIKVVCPHCDQPILVPADMLGNQAECPSCSKSFTITASIGEEAIKQCPFCAETIKAKAIKCRFCGSVLSGQSMEGANAHVNKEPLQKQQPQTNEPQPAEDDETICIVLTWLMPALGIVFAVIFSIQNKPDKAGKYLVRAILLTILYIFIYCVLFRGISFSI